MSLLSIARFTILLYENSVIFLTGEDNLVIKPLFEMLSSRAIQNVRNLNTIRLKRHENDRIFRQKRTSGDNVALLAWQDKNLDLMQLINPFK